VGERSEQAPLAPLTTLRIGGPARTLVTPSSEEEMVEAVREADGAGEPLLALAGGSNVVIADAGFDGTVVRVTPSGFREVGERDGRVLVEAAAGEPWDEFVAAMAGGGLAGIEALSGIPGSVGATPMQNVGAYGQEVASTIEEVRVFDRGAGAVRTLAPADCRFGYRTSALRGDSSLIVLSVTFALERAGQGRVAYAELASRLGVQPGGLAPVGDIREAVLELRRGKGMVLDEADHDTWSAGSFFTNPVLPQAAFDELRERAAAMGAPEPPGFPDGAGRVKGSAAWCIEQAGFSRGEARGAVALSGKHALALTNRGGATAGELLAFAHEIAGRVEELLGVRLIPEPMLVGLEW
jgi:UDP-N-acetylmuramate dehydrogenase